MLRLDRKALLREAAERLGPRMPRGWTAGDPTDPGWLLLEQAAWMVEVFSETLDRYPFSVLQQLIGRMGGELHPARPALGVVAVEVTRPSSLSVSAQRPDPATFYTRQSEARDAIAFCPVERNVDLRAWAGIRLTRLEQGALRDLSGSEGSGPVAWAQEPRFEPALNGEAIRFQIEAEPEVADALFKAACDAFQDGRRDGAPGWIRLAVERTPGSPPALRASLDVSAAFAKVKAEERLSEILGELRPLPGSTWTPPVFVSHDPALSSGVRGQPPLPGLTPGQIRRHRSKSAL